MAKTPEDDPRLHHTWRTVLLRHRLGKSIVDVTHNERCYGEGIIAQLAEEIGMPAARVQECLRVANTFTEKQILAMLRHDLTWSHILALSSPSIPASKRKDVVVQAIKEGFSAEDLRLAIQKKFGRRRFGRGGRKPKKRPELSED